MSDLTDVVLTGSLETLQMVALSTLLTVAGGLPLGVLLFQVNRHVHRPLSILVNVVRSMPFIILIILILPLTRTVFGLSAVGWGAMVIPLGIGAIPFFGRLVESALHEVDPGLREAGRSLGMNPTRLVLKVLLPEAVPALVRAVTVTIVALVGYSAMAGIVGGGGLGDVSLRYGYQRAEYEYLYAAVAVLIVGVQAVQSGGDLLARRLDRR